MSIIAEWMGKVFEVTERKILSLENLTTSLKLKKENNEDDSGSPPTNVKAYELENVKFDFVVSDAAGVDVRNEYEEWKTLVGEYGPFNLAGVPFGPDNLQLTEVSVSDALLDNLGRMRYAKISLTFQEWANEPSSQKGKPGSYIEFNDMSALEVYPTTDEKERYKWEAI